MRLALRLLVLLCTLCCAATLRAEEGARIMLVLDASGSMWGKVDGRPKIDIAKEVVGKVVGRLRPQDELGLVVYGHRQKGACDDIEVMQEAGPLDTGAFMSTINAISTKGKTPMTAAVKIAAESLRYAEKKSTVILVSDGLETCGLDPCAIAEALERQGVDFTMHTIGFNVDDPEAKPQLKCLAEKTGGIAASAENAAELEAALKLTLIAATAPSPPEPEPEPEQPPPPPPAPENNLTGHVTMAEGVELFAPYRDAVWEVFTANADGSRGAHVETVYGVDVKAKLDPGRYVVHVYSDGAQVNVPLTVDEADPYPLPVSLDAGVLHLTGYLDDTTEVTSENAIWEILNAQGEHKETRYGAKPNLLINAGDYIVRLTIGNAKAEQPVRVEIGKQNDVVVKLGAGQVEARAFFTAGGDPVESGMAFEIRKAELNTDGTYEWVATAYDPLARFSLPAGRYRLICNLDYATGSIEIDVKAAQVTKAAVVLEAGYLSVKAEGATVYEIFSAKKSISGERKQVATEYDAVNKAFEAGGYHVVAKASDGSVLGEKDYEVTAGERTEGSLP